jgi:hypothetical protein
MLPLIAIVALLTGGLVAIIVVLLKWNDIVDWFRGKRKLKEADKKNIAFTIKNAMKNGKIEVVQGIFNQDSEELIEGQKFEAKELDKQLEAVHKDKELVLYE